MFPIPFTGLRVIHDEKVRDAMERVRIDAEFARGSQRIVQMSLLRNVLKRIRGALNNFSRIELFHRTRNLSPKE
jgi:hypothetical protein